MGERGTGELEMTRTPGCGTNDGSGRGEPEAILSHRGRAMDAIDRYIERLSDPAVRSFKRMLNHVAEDELELVDRSGTPERYVVAAEEQLGMTLPPSYRELVTTTDPRDKEYGLYWVHVDGLDTYGEDIITVNQRFHDDYAPHFLIAV